MPIENQKTTEQLKALQIKAAAVAEKNLDKEVIVVTKGQQHVHVKPGNESENKKKDSYDCDWDQVIILSLIHKNKL